MKKYIDIEIVYARKDKQWVMALSVTEGTTIDLAIKQSCLLDQCKELHRHDLVVGVFGEVRRLSDVLKQGERIEIYRPLSRDPKEMRRLKSNT